MCAVFSFHTELYSQFGIKSLVGLGDWKEVGCSWGVDDVLVLDVGAAYHIHSHGKSSLR